MSTQHVQRVDTFDSKSRSASTLSHVERVDFSLVLPCFNESGLFLKSVERIIDALNAGTYSYEIIFVDDGSTDGTQKLIERMCKKYSFCHAIYHNKNMGRGKAVMDGIVKAKAEIVGYIDIDCEVSPVYVPYMVSIIAGRKADMVIGRRYYRTSPKSLFREVLSRGYQWLADVMVGTGMLDTESGYKIFRKGKIVPIFKRIEHQGWFWDTEIVVHAKRARLKIVEVPVLFLRRFDKQSSVNIVSDTIDYIVQLVRFSRLLK